MPGWSRPLIQHEIDHLDGILYSARIKPTVQTIPVEQYLQTTFSLRAARLPDRTGPDVDG
ncbi:peptide deformylase [Nocardia abscessus]|uniref:peptide deformylase n=1 Tax=Nocardia abscessus TaxID=120957 RepID=UPI003CC7FF18